jgi:hypothetical protein
MPLLIVLPAINLDGKLQSRTIKVDHVSAQRMLSPKAETVHLAAL